MDLQETLNALVDKLVTWIQDFVLLLPNFVVAVLIVLGFALLARIVRRIVTAGLGRFSGHQSIGDDLEKAKRVAMTAVEAVETRDTNARVELFYEGFGASSVDFVRLRRTPRHRLVSSTDRLHQLATHLGAAARFGGSISGPVSISSWSSQ